MAKPKHSEPGIQPAEFDIRRAPLPQAELNQLRMWMLANTESDVKAARKVGVKIGVLYRAKTGKIISARSLFQIINFLKSLPAVEA